MADQPPPRPSQSRGRAMFLLLLLLLLVAVLVTWAYHRNPPETPTPASTAVPEAVPGAEFEQ